MAFHCRDCEHTHCTRVQDLLIVTNRYGNLLQKALEPCRRRRYEISFRISGNALGVEMNSLR